MSPRRFALMRREEINAEPSVLAEGIMFHGGPVAVFWVHQQALRVHSSIDTIEFLDDPEGLMLVWVDPDPDEELKAQLGESTQAGVILDESQDFLVKPAPRRAREDSELSPLGISAPGRRYTERGPA